MECQFLVLLEDIIHAILAMEMDVTQILVVVNAIHANRLFLIRVIVIFLLEETVGPDQPALRDQPAI
jgi:hypothetical protein